MPYTPIIAPSDLTTHIYPEILAEITRDDNGALAAQAIEIAIGEAKIYLSRYDLVAIFGNDTTAATFSDPYLTGLIKVIAIWQLICLANPNINYETFRTRYEDTIAILKRIQDQKADPRWPYLDTTGLTTPPGIAMSIKTTKKRNNSY